MAARGHNTTAGLDGVAEVLTVDTSGADVNACSQLLANLAAGGGCRGPSGGAGCSAALALCCRGKCMADRLLMLRKERQT
jgi:hypothetical protein